MTHLVLLRNRQLEERRREQDASRDPNREGRRLVPAGAGHEPRAAPSEEGNEPELFRSGACSERKLYGGDGDRRGAEHCDARCHLRGPYRLARLFFHFA